MEIRSRTFEDLIRSRLEKIFEAMDAEEGKLFDRIIEQVEMMLKLQPDIFEELKKHKDILSGGVQKLADQAAIDAGKLDGEIQKERYWRSEVNDIEWDYRKSYLEKIIELVGKSQMVVFEDQNKGTLKPLEKKEFMEVKETEEETKEDVGTQVDKELGKKKKTSLKDILNKDIL